MTDQEGVFGFGLKPKSERRSPLYGMDLLTIEELGRRELLGLLILAAELKAHPRDFYHALTGKTLAMIFAKPSTRTRVSFEAGMAQLGGSAINLSPNDLQLGRGETVSDTAKVLSRFVDCIMIRTFAHSDVEEMANAAEVPVINGLTDGWHPCQILADLLTIAEVVAFDALRRKTRSIPQLEGAFAGVKVAYVGDGNNVANSLILGCAIAGAEISVATPQGYEVATDVVDQARAGWAGRVTVGYDPIEAVDGAHFIYTDVWVSMGQDEEGEARKKAFEGFMVDERLLAATGLEETKVLHCLPAHRGEEISAGVMDGPASIVFDQAENRMHAQKALLLALLLEHGSEWFGG